jgi:hypothetical protein
VIKDGVGEEIGATAIAEVGATAKVKEEVVT